MANNKALPGGAFRLAKKFVSQRAFPVLGLFILGQIIGVNLEDASASLPPTQENLNLALKLTLGLWDLAEGILLILILSWAVPQVHPLKSPKFLKEPFNRAYLGTFAAEYLRVLGRVLLWGILLLIPGFIRYTQLIFVAPIVFFSADYEADKVDALELSGKLARSNLKFLLGVLFLTTVTQMALELTPQMYAELHVLPIRLAFNLLSFLISIWSYSLILLMFEREMEKN